MTDNPEEVREAVARIREALRLGKKPDPKDVEVAVKAAEVWVERHQ